MDGATRGDNVVVSPALGHDYLFFLGRIRSFIFTKINDITQCFIIPEFFTCTSRAVPMQGYQESLAKITYKFCFDLNRPIWSELLCLHITDITAPIGIGQDPNSDYQTQKNLAMAFPISLL